ncbi:unnamed protein product [Dicrocoelium dendriticum]|nr:unnamed protein product [Dicrocoelium dendriticum]
MVLEEAEADNGLYGQEGMVDIDAKNNGYEELFHANHEQSHFHDSESPRTLSPYVVSKEEPKSWALDPRSSPEDGFRNLAQYLTHEKARHTSNSLTVDCELQAENSVQKVRKDDFPYRSQHQDCDEVFVTQQHTTDSGVLCNSTTDAPHLTNRQENGNIDNSLRHSVKYSRFSSESKTEKECVRRPSPNTASSMFDIKSTKERDGINEKLYSPGGSTLPKTSGHESFHVSPLRKTIIESPCEVEKPGGEKSRSKPTFIQGEAESLLKNDLPEYNDGCSIGRGAAEFEKSTQDSCFTRTRSLHSRRELQPFVNASSSMEKHQCCHRRDSSSNSCSTSMVRRPQVFYNPNSSKPSNENAYKKGYATRENPQTNQYLVHERQVDFVNEGGTDDHVHRRQEKMQCMKSVRPYIQQSQSLEGGSVYRSDYPPRQAQMERSFAPKYEYCRPSVPYSCSTTYSDDYVGRRMQKPLSFKPSQSYNRPEVRMESHTCHRDEFKWRENDEQESVYVRPRHRPPAEPFEGISSYSTDFRAKPIKRRNGFLPRDNLSIGCESGMHNRTTYQDEFVPYEEPMQSSYKPCQHYAPPEGQMEKITSYRSDYKPPDIGRFHSVNDLSSKCACCIDSYTESQNGRSHPNIHMPHASLLNSPNNHRKRVSINGPQICRGFTEPRSSSVALRRPVWRRNSRVVSLDRSTNPRAVSESGFADTLHDRYARRVIPYDEQVHTNEEMSYDLESSYWLPPGRTQNSQHIRMKLNGNQPRPWNQYARQNDAESAAHCTRLPPLPFNRAETRHTDGCFVHEPYICLPAVA